MPELDYNSREVHPLHVDIDPSIIIKIKAVDANNAIMWVESKATGTRIPPAESSVTIVRIPFVDGSAQHDSIDHQEDHFTIERDCGYHIKVYNKTVLTLTPQRKQTMTVHPLVSFQYLLHNFPYASFTEVKLQDPQTPIDKDDLVLEVRDGRGNKLYPKDH